MYMNLFQIFTYLTPNMPLHCNDSYFVNTQLNMDDFSVLAGPFGYVN